MPGLIAETGAGKGLAFRSTGHALAVVASDRTHLVLAVWTQGMRTLNGLPDVGDPFDVTEARRMIVIPDAENAYVLYKQAMAEQAKRPNGLGRIALKDVSWSNGSAGVVREYLDANRSALETWRRGTERPDAIDHQPGEDRFRHDASRWRRS